MIIKYIKFLVGIGWTQKRISDETGIQQPNVSRLINGTQDDVYFKQGKRLELIVEKIKKRKKRAK